MLMSNELSEFAVTVLQNVGIIMFDEKGQQIDPVTILEIIAKSFHELGYDAS